MGVHVRLCAKEKTETKRKRSITGSDFFMSDCYIVFNVLKVNKDFIYRKLTRKITNIAPACR
jgi:hypothetical protein